MTSSRARGSAYIVFPVLAAGLAIRCCQSRWHGNSELHTLLETVSFVLEFVAGAIALKGYRAAKIPTYLLLGSGLMGAAWLDAFHALITSSFLAGKVPAPLGAFAAWSEMAPRVFLALFLSVMAARERSLTDRFGCSSVHAAVGVSILISSLMLVCAPAAPAFYPHGLFRRPAELIPGLLFALAGAAHFHQRAWTRNGFEHWLILSLLAGGSGHIFYQLFSAEPYDMPSLGFHLLKFLSFALMLAALMSSVTSFYSREADAVLKWRRTSETLTREMEEKERAEAELLRSRDELELRVHERTRDLEEQSRQLKAAHAETELFLTSIPSILIGLDSQGRITRWNPTACATFGISAGRAMGQSLDDCGIRWLGADIRAEVHRWLRTETLYRCDELAFEKDGSTRCLGLSIRPIPASQEAAAKVLITGADVTERRKAEAAVAHLAAVVEGSDAAIVTVDTESRILSWNAAAERLYGYSLEEVKGRSASILWAPEHAGEMADILQRLNGSERIEHSETVRIRKGGGRVPVLISYSPIRDGSGKVIAACSIAVDITERKLLERQLAQAQKLESIGQLATGIAHEINTPIQYVGDNIRFLRDSFARLEELLEGYDRVVESLRDESFDGALLADIERLTKAMRIGYLRDEIPRSIEDSLDGAGRVAEIVRAIKEFSHPGPLEKTPLDINRAIESTVLVSRNEWKYVADVHVELDPNLPPVMCVPGEFNQVILNLIVNAAHAIADVVAAQPGSKGTITVTTQRDGEWAEIRVRDTGTGIPPDIQSSIFNPFFTTKEVGRGTGQGLAIAHSVIVQKHGGTISFDSAMGAGTTFTVRLPIGEDTAHPLASTITDGDNAHRFLTPPLATQSGGDGSLSELACAGTQPNDTSAEGIER